MSAPEFEPSAPSDSPAFERCSIRRASGYNLLPPHPVVSVVLKGYFDGSIGGADYITLAGLSGSFNAWTMLEERWARAVAPWKSPRASPTFKSWHSNDAFSLHGEFDKANGWNEKESWRVAHAIFNDCLSPVCWGKKKEFCVASATVEMDAYRRACNEFQDLRKVKPAEALLVDFVLSQAIWLLPANESGDGYDGKIELYFDRNERFMRQIHPVYRRRKKHWVGGLLASVAQSASEEFVALQATDVVAWTTNRSYTRPQERERHSWMLTLMTSLRHKLFRYDDIVASYRRALSLREQYDASSEQPLSPPA
jgi:hypothetical protein